MSVGRALLLVLAAASRFALMQAAYSGGSGTVDVVVAAPPCAWLALALREDRHPVVEVAAGDRLVVDLGDRVAGDRDSPHPAAAAATTKKAHRAPMLRRVGFMRP